MYFAIVSPPSVWFAREFDAANTDGKFKSNLAFVGASRCETRLLDGVGDVLSSDLWHGYLIPKN